MVRCPHTRGGEPLHRRQAGRDTKVVPTHVGVNRRLIESGATLPRCPHTRGGEPCVGFKLHREIVVVPTHVGVNR